MKRRYHDFSLEDPPPIRISSPAALHKVRSPVTLPDSGSNRADGAKTSEFAFFKKLKKDAGQKNPPHKLNSRECYKVVERTGVVRNNSKSLEGTDVAKKSPKDLRYPLSVGKTSCKELRSRLSVGKVDSKDSRSALPVKNTTQINSDLFPSPVDRAVNNSEVNLKNAFSVTEPIFSVEDWLEHNNNNKKPGESHSDEADIFSRKRQKLLQWVQNSFPETEECCSKGYDVISMLLGRLSPWSTENGYRSAESTLFASNTKSELFACPKSDVPSQKLHRLPTSKILEVEDTPMFLEIGTSSYWSDTLRETMISDIDSTTYNNHIAVQKYLEMPTRKLREKDLISCIDDDSTFGFPCVRHGSFLPFISSEEPDELHDSTIYNNHSSVQKYLELPTCKLQEKDLTSCIDDDDSTSGFPFVRSGSFLPFISSEEPDELHDSTIYNNHSSVQKYLELPTCKLQEKDLTSCIDDDDSTSGFPFVRRGSFLPFISSEEPDDLHDLNGYLPAREPLCPLLEWDSFNGTSSYWSDRSRENMHSNIYSPPYNNHHALQKNLESPSYELRQKKLISCIDSDSSFGFPFVRHGSVLPSSSFKEHDHLHDPTGYLPEREPHLPLLEWDSVNMNKSSVSDTYQNTDWTIIPALQCSWDHHQSQKIPFSSFKKPDDSLDPFGSSPGREPHLPLLEWRSVNVNERSSSATCQDTNWTLVPAVQSSWDHQQSLNNWCESFGTLGLYSPPILENYPQDFYTLVPSTSASYDKHESGRSILETEEELIVDLQQLPLTFSHSPKCLDLIPGCSDYEIACRGSKTSDILPSPENHLGFMSNEENDTPGFGNQLFFAPNVQWKSYNQVV